MNHLLSFQSVIAVAVIVSSTVTAQAQVIQSPINAGTLLTSSARCDHVIELIHQHGVNNSVDRAHGRSLLHQSPFGGLEIPDTELGDLEILQVSQVIHQDEACGPRIAVDVRNQSCRKVCNFQVTGVAMLGRILPTSPSVTVRVAEILPGAALQIQLQLPIEALAMGNRNGQIIGFQRLVVAIDSFDELLETNEANNIRSWNLAEIPVAQETVVEEVSATAIENGVTDVLETSQVESSQPPGDPANTVTPTDPRPDAIRKAILQIDTEAGQEQNASDV